MAKEFHWQNRVSRDAEREDDDEEEQTEGAEVEGDDEQAQVQQEIVPISKSTSPCLDQLRCGRCRRHLFWPPII